MEQREPACRGGFYDTDHSALPHVSHDFFPDPRGAAIMCLGWSERDDDAAALVMRLDQVAIERNRKMAPGTRLECHPLVYRALQQLFIPSYAELVPSLHTGEAVLKPQIPVVVIAGMGRGEWRLVADDGQIAEGVVRNG